MTEISVRAAKHEDSNILIQMITELQDYEYMLHRGRRPGREVAKLQYTRVVEAAKNFRGAVLVANFKNEIVGMIAGWIIIEGDLKQDLEFREHGYISDLFVKDEVRGKDVAQLLLRAIQEQLVANGARRLSINALARNGPIITACRTFGFKPYEIKLEKSVEV